MEKTADEKFISSSDTGQSRYFSQNYCHFLGRVKREKAEGHTLLELVYFKCVKT